MFFGPSCHPTRLFLFFLRHPYPYYQERVSRKGYAYTLEVKHCLQGILCGVLTREEAIDVPTNSLAGFKESFLIAFKIHRVCDGERKDKGRAR